MGVIVQNREAFRDIIVSCWVIVRFPRSIDVIRIKKKHRRISKVAEVFFF